MIEVILINKDKNNNYVFATVHRWNVDAYKRHVSDWPGNWTLITKQEELSKENIKKLNSRYIFFPHWSWRVPSEILDLTECVCFHMTDLPYGRGGSPLQNLILRGHNSTFISALKMTSDIDAGSIYVKKLLKLKGNAQKIYEDSAEIICQIITSIINEEPEAEPQKGEPVYFSRRTPQESKLPKSISDSKLYDFIRMLDAEGYPKAFLDHGSLNIEFFEAHLEVDGTVSAKVKIKPESNKKKSR